MGNHPNRSRRDPRIEEITHEADREWFVYLVPGWQLDGAHCFGEDRRGAIRETMKRVRPCQCAECSTEATVADLSEHIRNHIH